MTKDKRLGSDPLTWLKDEENGQAPDSAPQDGKAEDVLDFLGQSEPRWSRSEVLENLPMPVCVASLLGEMHWANPAFCELSGYEPGELAQKNWRDVFNSASDHNLGRRKVKTSQNKTYPSTLISPAGDSLDIIINRFFGKAAGLEEGYFFAALELPAAPPPEPEVIERIVEVVKEAESPQQEVAAPRRRGSGSWKRPRPHAPPRCWPVRLTHRRPRVKKPPWPQGPKTNFWGCWRPRRTCLAAAAWTPPVCAGCWPGLSRRLCLKQEVDLEIDAASLSVGRALAAAWVLICLGWSSDPAKEAEKAKKKSKRKARKRDHDGHESLDGETPDDQADQPLPQPLQLSISTQSDGGCLLRIWGGELPSKLKLGKGGPMDLLAGSLAALGGGLLGVRGQENQFLAMF